MNVMKLLILVSSSILVEDIARRSMVISKLDKSCCSSYKEKQIKSNLEEEKPKQNKHEKARENTCTFLTE